MTFFRRPVAEILAVLELDPAMGLVLEPTSIGPLRFFEPLMTRPILVLRLKPVLARFEALPLGFGSPFAGEGPGTLPKPRRLASPPKAAVPMTDCGRPDDRSICSGKAGMLLELLTPGTVYSDAEEGLAGTPDVGVDGLAGFDTEIKE